MAKTKTKTKVSTRTKVAVALIGGGLAIAAGIGYWNSRRSTLLRLRFMAPKSQLPEVKKDDKSDGSPFGSPPPKVDENPKESTKKDGDGRIDEPPTTATTTADEKDVTGLPTGSSTGNTTTDPTAAGSGAGSDSTAQ